MGMKPRVRPIKFADLPYAVRERFESMWLSAHRRGYPFWPERSGQFKNFASGSDWFYLCRHDDSWWKEVER